MAASKKKMFRFSNQNDIQLLKEFFSVNPYGGDAMTRWASVAENFNDINMLTDTAIDGRRCRERTALLVSHFRSDEREKIGRSGTEEEITEKEALLAEISLLVEEAASRPKANPKKDEAKQAGAAIRKRALETLKKQNSDEEDPQPDGAPLAAKRRKHDVMAFIEGKAQKERELEQEKIKLEREKLQLETKKEEREHERFKLEKEERLVKINLLKNLISK